MALTLQQQIAQQEQARAEREQAIMNFRKQSRADRRALREDLRARGEPKRFHPEMLALFEQQRADPLGFALGKNSVAAVGMGTRDLRRGIESLQRQVSQPFSQLSNLVKGGSDQLVQKGLSGQVDLGDVAVSVSGRQPVSLEKAASKHGMSVPQFLQMNPQYAGRSQLSPGEIYKVTGQASSLPEQLQAQQMRYDANVSPELAQLLQNPAQGGILNAYNNVSNLRKRRARFSNQAANLAEQEGITRAAAKQQLRNEGGGLSEEQRATLKASRGKLLGNESAILNPLFSSLGMSAEMGARRASQGGLNLEALSQAAGSLQPLSLEQSQLAYVQQTGELPQTLQDQFTPAPTPAPQQVQQAAPTQNWYDAPQFQYQQQPYYGGYQQTQQQQPYYGGYQQSQQQQPYYGGYQQSQQQQPYYGGYQQSQQQQPYYGGYQQQASPMYGGIGGMGNMMPYGGSGLV
jgi:hypothetical protein